MEANRMKSFFDENTETNTNASRVIKSSPSTEKYILCKDLPINGAVKSTIITYYPKEKIAEFPNNIKVSNLDVNNKEYFKKVNIKFNIGDYVVTLNNNKLYYISDVDYIHGRYCIREYSNSVYEKGVPAYKLKQVKVYYFINSEGKKCMTFLGKNSNADTWRALTKNMFKSMEEVDKYILSVKNAEEVQHF